MTSEWIKIKSAGTGIFCQGEGWIRSKVIKVHPTTGDPYVDINVKLSGFIRTDPKFLLRSKYDSLKLYPVSVRQPETTTLLVSKIRMYFTWEKLQKPNTGWKPNGISQERRPYYFLREKREESYNFLCPSSGLLHWVPW